MKSNSKPNSVWHKSSPDLIAQYDPYQNVCNFLNECSRRVPADSFQTWKVMTAFHLPFIPATYQSLFNKLERQIRLSEPLMWDTIVYFPIDVESLFSNLEKDQKRWEVEIEKPRFVQRIFRENADSIRIEEPIDEAIAIDYMKCLVDDDPGIDYVYIHSPGLCHHRVSSGGVQYSVWFMPDCDDSSETHLKFLRDADYIREFEEDWG